MLLKWGQERREVVLLPWGENWFLGPQKEPAGVSKLLAFLGHTGRRRVVLGHIKYIVTRNHKQISMF